MISTNYAGFTPDGLALLVCSKSEGRAKAASSKIRHIAEIGVLRATVLQIGVGFCLFLILVDSFLPFS